MRRFALPVALVTLTALVLFVQTLLPNGFGFWDAALAALFTVLFGWTAAWCWLSTLGAAELWRARRRADSERPTRIESSPLLPWTAVLIPVHNEDPESVFSRLTAMLAAPAEQA